MNDDRKNTIDVDAYSKKETYSAEEKKMIMQRLDEERRINQKIASELTKSTKHYSQSEKNKILNKLNEQRLSKQKCEEIEKARRYNKEIYTFGTKSFYKFMHMEREYYIQIEDCAKVSSRPSIVSLYYRTFEELKKRDVLMKVEIYSDKFFISYDAMRVYFKSYALENRRKK